MMLNTNCFIGAAILLGIIHAAPLGCKCIPSKSCWPSSDEWAAFNRTLGGALIKGIPPGSVCYKEQPNFSEAACQTARDQWTNSTWQAEQPIGVDYPIWTNNSCDAIYANGTSVTGDPNAGQRGCSLGGYAVYAVDGRDNATIAAALTWADARNIRVVVKSTGHSFPGRSTGAGSLSIWTHNLRGSEYLPAFKPYGCSAEESYTALRLAAGYTGADAQVFAARHNSIVTTGANPDVGIVGWLTGGGHGWLSSTYGMGADNLLEATIVTPLGDVLVTNPCQNLDIFFAIRGGGGGTYGVVTQVVVRTYPTPSVTTLSFQLSTLSPNRTTEFWHLMGLLHADMVRLRAGGLQGYYYMVGPPWTPGLTWFGTFMTYNKANGTVEALMAPFEGLVAAQPDVFTYQTSIAHFDNYFDTLAYAGNEAVANGGAGYASWLMAPESFSDINMTAKAFAQVGPSSDALKPSGPISNSGFIGHFVASPETSTYYPDTISMNPAWRKALVHLIIAEGWQDGISRQAIDAVYEDLTMKNQVLATLSPGMGAYFNEPDSNQPEWQSAFFGDNYDRLLSIKHKVDPRNVLWCNKCVGSEALLEGADGELCAA